MKSLSLEGRTILVTRARPQAGVFSQALSELGAEVLEVPTIEIIPMMSAELDASIRALAQYDWVFFTSANGVRIFFERFRELVSEKQARIPKICAIGPATSREVGKFGYTVALQPSLFQAEGILEELSTLCHGDLSGLKILIPRARVARKILPEKLRELGADVAVVPVYETRLPAGTSELLAAALNRTDLDLITFTSSSTVHNLVSLAEKAEDLADYDCAAIGPITAETARKYGLRVVLQPENSTIPDFVKAIEKYLTSSA